MVKLADINWYDVLGYHRVKKVEELEDFLSRGYCVVHCDASYRKLIGTCSVQIISPNREYKKKDHEFNAVGSNEAEAKSILFGLRELAKLSLLPEKVIIANDNYFAINNANGKFNRIKENMLSVGQKIDEELGKLDCILEFAWVSGKVNKVVDKSAKRKLKSREQKIEERIKKRVKRVCDAIERSKELVGEKRGEKVVLIKNQGHNYEVRFDDSFGCSCHYWQYQWSEKDISYVYSRALPCKCMCKASEILGLDIFEIFKKQIYRRD